MTSCNFSQCLTPLPIVTLFITNDLSTTVTKSLTPPKTVTLFMKVQVGVMDLD